MAASPATTDTRRRDDDGARAGAADAGWHAIETDGLGVEYSLRLTRRTTIRHSFTRMFHRHEGDRTFWALRRCSIRIRPGEVVAVIGSNGAGKTTLLQVLGGIIRPTEGTVTVRGAVTSLLGAGAGFDTDLTGRENIALCGAFLGVEERELRARTEAIVAFADIGEFIDAPVRTYSLGMRARLGFSIAAVVDPDVLLLDEAVSTGDQEYRARARTQIARMVRTARAIVLVTHDLQWVTEFCTRAIILDRGTVIADGPPTETVALYQDRSRPR